MFDPLLLVKEAVKKRMLSEKILSLSVKRMKYIEEAIKKVEKATGVKYPLWYLAPYALIMQSPLGETAILYARNKPIISKDKMMFAVEFTLPLHLYASKDTLLAVVAHEFTHYIELAKRINEFEILSSEISTTVFEASYRDVEEAIKPELIFGRYRSIVRLLKERFLDGLSDDALNNKTMKRWIEKGLPTVNISPEENVIRIPMKAILNLKLDESLIRLLRRIRE